VLASNHEPGNAAEDIAGVHVIRRHVNANIKSQPISLNFFSGIRPGSYDLIHFHSPNPLVTAQFMLHRLLQRKAPVVVTHHMDIYGRKLLRALALPMIRSLIRNARYTIVTSSKNVAVSQDLPRDARYVPIPLAIKAEDFVIDDQLRTEALEWRRSICGTAPVIGYVGRHARYKGLPVLVDALNRMPGVHALIGGDGAYREVAEARARELGISDRVHFLGRLSHRDKLKLLAALDVFAFPSTEITEAFGISQMEAMLCGTPVVASDLPTGVTDVAVDGVTALTAPPGDAVQLAQKLQVLIADRALAGKLADQARRHVLDKMTFEAVSRKTLSILEAAMQGEPQLAAT
jgi:rhamnosyl/mannosyltransferase